MKDKESILISLKIERHELNIRINKLNKLKYDNIEEFKKLGSIMCQMLDTQLEIMNSYFEILTLRILYLEENKYEKILY